MNKQTEYHGRNEFTSADGALLSLSQLLAVLRITPGKRARAYIVAHIVAAERIARRAFTPTQR